MCLFLSAAQESHFARKCLRFIIKPDSNPEIVCLHPEGCHAASSARWCSAMNVARISVLAATCCAGKQQARIESQMVHPQIVERWIVSCCPSFDTFVHCSGKFKCKRKCHCVRKAGRSRVFVLCANEAFQFPDRPAFLSLSCF